MKYKANDENIRDIIQKKIEEKGNNTTLNYIDVSKVTNMNSLFFNSKFIGDISKWDVSNVKDMSDMFYGSTFNGDISEWDVSNVKDMSCMFYGSKFNGDISKWNLKIDTDITLMFDKSSISDDNLIKFILKNHKNKYINEIIENMGRWQDYIVDKIKPEILCDYLRYFYVEYETIKGSKIENLDCAMDVYPELALADIFTL